MHRWADACRYLPGAIEGTFVTMPANGAITTVWSSWRAASFRCATTRCSCEVLLTVKFAIIILDVVLGLFDLREHVLVVRFERVQIVPDGPSLRVSALQCQPKREIIQAEQNLALFDWLVIADIDLLDDSGDVGRDADLVG